MTGKSLCWMVFVLIWRLLFCLFIHLCFAYWPIWHKLGSSEKREPQLRKHSSQTCRKKASLAFSWLTIDVKEPSSPGAVPSLDGDQWGNRKAGRASDREQGTKQHPSMVSASVFVSMFLPWVPPSVINDLASLYVAPAALFPIDWMSLGVLKKPFIVL